MLRGVSAVATALGQTLAVERSHVTQACLELGLLGVAAGLRSSPHMTAHRGPPSSSQETVSFMTEQHSLHVMIWIEISEKCEIGLHVFTIRPVTLLV